MGIFRKKESSARPSLHLATVQGASTPPPLVPRHRPDKYMVGAPSPPACRVRVGTDIHQGLFPRPDSTVSQNRAVSWNQGEPGQGTKWHCIRRLRPLCPICKAGTGLVRGRGGQGIQAESTSSGAGQPSPSPPPSLLLCKLSQPLNLSVSCLSKAGGALGGPREA